MAIRSEWAGFEEMEANFRTLSRAGQRAVAGTVIRAGLAVVARRARSAAPKLTGALKGSIGTRVLKQRGGTIGRGKVGIDVGRPRVTVQNRGGAAMPSARWLKKHKFRKQLRAMKLRAGPHGHLVAMGTRARVRTVIRGKFAYLEARPGGPRSRSTGTMPRNPFFRNSVASAQAEAVVAMHKKLGQAIGREAEKDFRKGRASARRGPMFVHQ
jgi:HK97 gp10 family phage protein